MLAKGGFEVSAEMIDGTTQWVRVKSLKGQMAKLYMANEAFVFCESADGSFIPAPFQRMGDILCFDTEPDGSYYIGNPQQQITSLEASDVAQDIFVYESHFSRRGFAGKDKHTDYIKILDSFLFDHYVANERCRVMHAYRFNLGGDVKRNPYEPCRVRLGHWKCRTQSGASFY